MNFFNEDMMRNSCCDQPNYYQILGCDQNSSMEQISTEYKLRALACHPDKNHNNSEANKEFQLLVEAKETLTNESMRNKYDFWLNSGICISWKEWLKLNNGNKPVFHWMIKKQEPMITDSTFNATANSNSSTCRTSKLNEELSQFRSANHHVSDHLSKFRNHQI